MTSNELLFYDQVNGALTIKTVDGTGHLVTGQSSAARPGWTNILAAGFCVVFYNSADGSLTTGEPATREHTPTRCQMQRAQRPGKRVGSPSADPDLSVAVIGMPLRAPEITPWS
jgi:hypothetical protein